MRIESTGIYTRNGQIGKVAPGVGGNVRAKSSPEDVKKADAPIQNFSAILSEAETAQLTKLFGKFDLKEISKDTEVPPEDNRPGQIIDILV
jgi:hypothetical protein